MLDEVFMSRPERRRSHAAPPQSITLRDPSRRLLKLLSPFFQVDPELDIPRPITRADCANVPRPCPFVSCKFHLYLDTRETGSVKLNFPDLEPGDLEQSCALDIADEGPQGLEVVARALNVTYEGARQTEERALRNARRRGRKARDDE